MLKCLILGHTVYILLLAISYPMFQYITHTLSVNFIETNLDRIFEYMETGDQLCGFVYNSCFCVVILFWVLISFLMSHFTLDRLFYHCVSCKLKSLSWQWSLYILIKLYNEDYEWRFCYAVTSYLLVLLLFAHRERYVRRSLRFVRHICILLFTLLRMYCCDWDKHWIWFTICFAIADELEHIIHTAMFSVHTFIPVLYTTSLKHIRTILSQDLYWAFRIYGNPELGVRKRTDWLQIWNVCNEVLVRRKSPLHGSYEHCNTEIISAHILLVSQPFINPNYCESNGLFPLWYKIRTCCYFRGRVRHLRNGQNRFCLRHSTVANTYKGILLEFMINVQAGLTISSYPLKAVHCLYSAVKRTDKTKVFVFLKEAGILAQFGMLKDVNSEKWDKFNYPLSLKRLCGNFVRLSVGRNAFLGVKLLSRSHHLPPGCKLGEFITLCDIFESYEEISRYIWSESA